MSDLPFVFLGLDEVTGEDRGVLLEKNLLTFAGARSGKGACHIIPNLKRWPHNVLVIDPKGEAAEITAAERAGTFGKTVAVIDPYDYAAKLDPSFRAGFNPLELAETADDLHMIAGGIIKRSAQESQPHWNNSAQAVLAGLLAYILETPDYQGSRHLGSLRLVLSLLHAGDADTLADMKACSRFGGLAAEQARRLSAGTSEVSNILSTLDTQTEFLTSEKVAATLSVSGFYDGRALNLRDMKNGQLDLFLVLPPGKLDKQGQFLRLFVQIMLSLMQEKTPAGDQLGQRCLFILDEFHSLGRLQEVVTASGQLPSSGVHLWPFVQSIGQLTELYGQNGLETFTEDADALTIFGVRGVDVCEYASRRMGKFKPDDLADKLTEIGRELQAHQSEHAESVARRERFQAVASGFDRPERRPRSGAIAAHIGQPREYVANHDLLTAQAYMRSKVGQPYMQADEVRQEVRKHENEKVPRRLLMFATAGAIFLKPQPWFAPKPVPQVAAATPHTLETRAAPRHANLVTPFLKWAAVSFLPPLALVFGSQALGHPFKPDDWTANSWMWFLNVFAFTWMGGGLIALRGAKF